MKKRRWYRKKRMYLFFIFVIYLAAIQLEWAKFRYDPENLKQIIVEKTQIEPLILQKDFEGKSIQYFQVGQNEEAPVIAFVHGSPGSLADYKSYLSNVELSQKATMLSIDRLGFGYSDFGNTESSLSIQAKSIMDVLKPYKENKIILVGHSLGGPVIAKMAMDFPKLIDGIILIAPSISPQLEPSTRWREIANWKLFQWLIPTALRVCNQEIIPLKEELEQSMEGWKNIKVPATVIQGEKDKLVPKGNADFAKKMLVNSSSVDMKIIKNGNHFILWSETELVKNAILDLLKKVE
jgi:pimeloyl-ACP methyl ester carboxylesterase